MKSLLMWNSHDLCPQTACWISTFNSSVTVVRCVWLESRAALRACFWIDVSKGRGGLQPDLRTELSQIR